MKINVERLENAKILKVQVLLNVKNKILHVLLVKIKQHVKNYRIVYYSLIKKHAFMG